MLSFLFGLAIHTCTLSNITQLAKQAANIFRFYVSQLFVSTFSMFL